LLIVGVFGVVVAWLAVVGCCYLSWLLVIAWDGCFASLLPGLVVVAQSNFRVEKHLPSLYLSPILLVVTIPLLKVW